MGLLTVLVVGMSILWWQAARRVHDCTRVIWSGEIGRVCCISGSKMRFRSIVGICIGCMVCPYSVS